MSAPATVAAPEGTDVAPAGPVCGDVLVQWGDVRPVKGRDGSTRWETAARHRGWTVLRQPPSASWRGFPVTVLDSPPWKIWIIGEASGRAEGSTGSAFFQSLVRGERPGSAINGHLAVFAWNETERSWHAWTDRFGTIHLYHASDGSRAALGTFAPAVAASASRKRLDWEALSGFFAFGYFQGDRTHHDDVRILRPASHYVFDENGRLQRQERYWEWSHRPDSRRTLEETTAGFADALHAVLDEETEEGRIALPISGGLDSRTAVAALTRTDRRPGDARFWSYSYGYSDDSVEIRIAGKIARRRRLPFRPLTIGPYLFDRIDEIAACVEGFNDLTQSRQAAATALLAGEADAVIAAHVGDVWLDDIGLVGAGKRDRPDLVSHAIARTSKRGGDWLLQNVARPNLGRDPGEALRGAVGRELQGLESIEDADFRVKAFKISQWIFRWTFAGIRMYQAGVFQRLPFCDTRLTDFFATVPSSFVAGRGLQIEYLKRFAPDLARVTWQAYETNLFRYRYYDSWLLPARALRKLRRTLAPPRMSSRNWEVQFRGERGQRGLAEWLTRPGLRLHDLVARERIEELLGRFRAQPLEEGRGYTVSMLLTLSAWLERHA